MLFHAKFAKCNSRKENAKNILKDIRFLDLEHFYNLAHMCAKLNGVGFNYLLKMLVFEPVTNCHGLNLILSWLQIVDSCLFSPLRLTATSPQRGEELVEC